MKDYESYRLIQNEGFQRKRHGTIFAKEGNIIRLARYATEKAAPVRFCLCHGTRNGAELRWFKAHLPPDARVLGTDIGAGASQYPDTIEWDFHELKDEWLGACDVIYSNSWDHAFDPERAFKNWMRCLSPNGVLFLEHSIHHSVGQRELDPFRATLRGLIELVRRIGEPEFEVREVLRDLPERDSFQSVIVVGRKSQR